MIGKQFTKQHQLTLETGFIYEASKIKQTGDETKEREFSYPKPRAILTWQAAESDQVRTSITREVAQLDFTEFASAINVVDQSSVIGNPDLEPEKTWRARAEWEHKFGPRAALTLAVFHDQVEDVQEFHSAHHLRAAIFRRADPHPVPGNLVAHVRCAGKHRRWHANRRRGSRRDAACAAAAQC